MVDNTCEWGGVSHNNEVLLLIAKGSVKEEGMCTLKIVQGSYVNLI